MESDYDCYCSMNYKVFCIGLEGKLFQTNKQTSIQITLVHHLERVIKLAQYIELLVLRLRSLDFSHLLFCFTTIWLE